jgi:hypothetical protein
VQIPGPLFQVSNDEIQRLPFDVLHAVKIGASIVSDGIYGYDVRMIQLRSRLRLVLKPRNLSRIQYGGERQHFDGDLAA